VRLSSTVGTVQMRRTDVVEESQEILLGDSHDKALLKEGLTDFLFYLS
jgi:hypothetical protein